jgi:type I restriction enzyme S subunit
MKTWEITSAQDKITHDAIEQSATNLVPANTVLVVNRSGILKHTLPVAITRRPVAINQDMKALICGDRIDPDYLARMVKAAEPIVLAWVRATTADNYPIENLKSFEIPLPPLEEQKRIAAILDQADSLRRLRQRTIDRLNTLGQAIFYEMFGDLLTNDKGHDFGQVSSIVRDFSTGKNIAADPDSQVRSSYRVIKVSAVTSGRFNWQESKPLPIGYQPPERHFVRAGDLLFSRANTFELIGATAVVNEVPKGIALPDKVWRFEWYPNKTPNVQFVHYLFQSPPFRREISRRASGTSGSMKNIAKQKVLSIPIGLPPESEQALFAERIEVVDTQIAASYLQKTRIDGLFTSFQHRAFRGEL